jgi:ATP/ADP translocase
MVTTILIAPVVNLTGSSFLIGSRSLMCGSIYHAGNYSTEYSFNRASREILYIPTDKDFKYQGKAIVETFVCRLGDGLTSLLLILTGLPLHSMSFLNLFISILRFIPAIALAGHYKTMIKKEKDIA